MLKSACTLWIITVDSLKLKYNAVIDHNYAYYRIYILGIVAALIMSKEIIFLVFIQMEHFGLIINLAMIKVGI